MFRGFFALFRLRRKGPRHFRCFFSSFLRCFAYRVVQVKGDERWAEEIQGGALLSRPPRLLPGCCAVWAGVSGGR